jgi:hypothetical protein
MKTSSSEFSKGPQQDSGAQWGRAERGSVRISRRRPAGATLALSNTQSSHEDMPHRSYGRQGEETKISQ